MTAARRGVVPGKMLALCSGLLLLSTAGTAHAYVDPVTSSTLWQVLSALFIVLSAGFVFLKNQLLGLLRALGRLLGRRKR